MVKLFVLLLNGLALRKLLLKQEVLYRDFRNDKKEMNDKWTHT